MSLKTNKINKIKEIKSLNEINNYNDLKNNHNLTISFDNNSNKIINDFFADFNNKDIVKHYYSSNDYSFELDLLEDVKDINLYLWFINCVNKANNIVHSNSNKYIRLFGIGQNLSLSVWKISICKNIMFNFPFTLQDVIFMPIDYILDMYKSSNKKKIINTLVHEKIHIAQRFNEVEWEKFINEQNLGWVKILPNSQIFKFIDNNLRNNNSTLLNKDEKFIYNPDTFYPNFKYIYVNDEIYYYGHYVWNNKTFNIKKKYFKIDFEKNTFILTNKELEEEHPYEVFAYRIADELVK